MRRRYIGIALAGIAVLAAAGTANAAFGDVAGHWANSVVSLLEAKGLVSGDGAARFQPEASLTRAQLAKLLVSGLGHSADADQLKGAPSRFADLPATHWATGWVEALAELGVTAGYPDGTFHPDASLTRAEAAVLVARAAGLQQEAQVATTTQLPFVDGVVVPNWATGAVQAAAAAGLIQGDSSGLFRPFAPLTRAEGAAILYRLTAMQGRLIHLSGTLVAWSPATREGTVRDALGNERPFQLAADATLFQAGQLTSWAGIRRLDQVWVVFGPDGSGRYMEARYRDLLGQSATVTGRSMRLQVDGQTRVLTVQQGALVYINGAPASLDQVGGANLIYLTLDWMTGDVRAIDAVKTTLQGALTEVLADGSGFSARVADQARFFYLAPGVQPYLLGAGRVPLTTLPVASKLYLNADEAGQVSYLFAQR